jgi:hypothetical protein
MSICKKYYINEWFIKVPQAVAQLREPYLENIKKVGIGGYGCRSTTESIPLIIHPTKNQIYD